jgi:hypothetical protein
MPVTAVALLKTRRLACLVSAAPGEALAEVCIAILAARRRCFTGRDKGQPGDHHAENKEFPENLRYKYLFHFSSLLYGN